MRAGRAGGGLKLRSGNGATEEEEAGSTASSPRSLTLPNHKYCNRSITAMSGLSLQTTGGVSSRFVSETDLDAAKATRDEEWKAAYER
jgi:hypothetical protein